MGGGTLGANTESITDAHESSKRRASQYKREKLDPQTEAGQNRFGQVTGDAYDSFTMGMEGVGDFVERNTRSLRPQSDDDQGNDTAEMNYSTSGVSKSSSGVGKKADLKDKKDKKTQGPSRTFTIKNK